MIKQSSRVASSEPLKIAIDVKALELFERWQSDLDVQAVLAQDIEAIKRDKFNEKWFEVEQQRTVTKQRRASPTNSQGGRVSSPTSLPYSPRSSNKASQQSETKEHRRLAKECSPKVQLFFNEFLWTEAVPGTPKRKPQGYRLIPRFFFPQGRPNYDYDQKSDIQNIKSVFAGFKGGRASLINFKAITKACGFPSYCKVALFLAVNPKRIGHVDLGQFLQFWNRLTNSCFDLESRFIGMLTNLTRKYLVPDDFEPIVKDILESHPGLEFLRTSKDFHGKYIQTVIARVFYSCNRMWQGRIIASDVKKCAFLQVLELLDTETDINRVTDFFSYEHFYVIYCKFWTLDSDHDMWLSREDFVKHNDSAIVGRMVDRILSYPQSSRWLQSIKASRFNQLSYMEFVWFLISEEDKQSPIGIEYWFRMMDMDSDGYLSLYEMEYFYDEQADRVEVLGFDLPSFDDLLCQMLDMIRPAVPNQIALSDLKRNPAQSEIFFDTFFNLDKFIDREQRNPFVSHKATLGTNQQLLSQWELYAADEYEFLAGNEDERNNQSSPITKNRRNSDIDSERQEETAFIMAQLFSSRHTETHSISCST